jgi:hypothetical protein
MLGVRLDDAIAGCIQRIGEFFLDQFDDRGFDASIILEEHRIARAAWHYGAEAAVLAPQQPLLLGPRRQSMPI